IRRRDHRTSVIVLSAYMSTDMEAEARALGAAAVLRKPQSLPDLAPLPPPPSPAWGAAGAEQWSDERMGKKKILVVDDSRTALFMVTTILRKERYELVTASDGEQALQMAESEHPDL